MSDTPTKKNWFKRHKIITGILAALIIFGIIGAIGDSSTPANTAPVQTVQASSNTAAHTSSAPQPATPGLNQEARDGKFAFTVTSFICGETEITQADNSYENAQAQGQFCLMNVNVKNIGSVAQTFDASSQYVYDAGSKQYSSSSDGTIAANPSNSDFAIYETVNPGVNVSGTIAFDLPKGVTPTYAKLHDSGASNGVRVNLQK